MNNTQYIIKKLGNDRTPFYPLLIWYLCWNPTSIATIRFAVRAAIFCQLQWYIIRGSMINSYIWLAEWMQLAAITGIFRFCNSMYSRNLSKSFAR